MMTFSGRHTESIPYHIKQQLIYVTAVIVFHFFFLITLLKLEESRKFTYVVCWQLNFFLSFLMEARIAPKIKH